MKAISLWQPWASLIMLGAKRVETRSWRPPEALIGARVMIHAAKHLDPVAFMEPFASVLGHHPSSAPRGALLGSVLLEGAWRIDHAADAELVAHEYHRLDGGGGRPVFDVEAAKYELAFGDYTVGRWAWGLADVRRLREPISYRGGQRFFNVENTVAAAQGGEHLR